MSNVGIYTPDPGTVEMAVCGICGDEMNVTRNVNGPRGLLMAMNRSKSWHDFLSVQIMKQIGISRYAHSIESRDAQTVS